MQRWVSEDAGIEAGVKAVLCNVVEGHGFQANNVVVIQL
jgi:hypothetical protein